MDKKLQLKHLPDLEILRVVQAYQRLHGVENMPPYALADQFPEKLVMKKLEQLENRGLIECGVSLRTGWLTEAGERLLAELEQRQPSAVQPVQ